MEPWPPLSSTRGASLSTRLVAKGYLGMDHIGMVVHLRLKQMRAEGKTPCKTAESTRNGARTKRVILGLTPFFLESELFLERTVINRARAACIHHLTRAILLCAIALTTQ